MNKFTTQIRRAGPKVYLEIFERYTAAREEGYVGIDFLEKIIVPEFNITRSTAELYVMKGRKMHKANLKKEKKENKAA